MAKMTIRRELSVDGIQDIIDAMKSYKAWLSQGTFLFCKRLGEIGLEVAEAHIGESPIGKYVHVAVESKQISKHGAMAMIVAGGEVRQQEGYEPFSTLLAIEFGAGIHYNKTENPKADEFGMGVGTFPGQVHAFQEQGWYYWDAGTQEWRHSFGVKATMPMYNAGLAIRTQVVQIAKEVFSHA